ncbi:AAA family ATPase [Methanococcoides sp. SA1]|nr:AAA family ATPase [Methanococcoides sp. SA1]
MKITDLNIDGFGKFNDLSINGLGEGLTVLHGENEAGKSTLLSFIRRMLFGFPDKRSKCNHYPPFKGGLHGGRLSVYGDDGDTYTLERYAKDGLKVYLPDGTIKGEAELGKLLGNADKDVFENVYAFGLDELQDFNRLNGESISGKLYSAGTGIGAASISSIQRFCDNKKGDLFKPSGKKPLINSLFTGINNIEQNIKDIEDGQYNYDLLHSDIGDKEKEISELKEKKSALLEKQEHIKALLSVWDDWVELQIHASKLEELPKLESFPEDGLNRYDSIKEKIQDIDESIAGLNSSIERNLKQQGNIVVDDVLLAQKDVVFELGKGVEKYRAEMEELPDLKISLKGGQKRLGAMLQELGPDWDEEKLNGFDRSIPAIDAVRKRHGELNSLDSEISVLRQELKVTTYSISKKDQGQDAVYGKILMQRSAILNMADRVAGYRANAEEIISDLIKLDGNKKELANVLQDIGSKWDESILEYFDISSSVKDHVSAMKAGIHDTELNIRDFEKQLEWLNKDILRIDGSIDEVDTKINSIDVHIPEAELSEMLISLKNLQGRYSSLKDKEMDLKSLERDENLASIMGQRPIATSQKMPMWPAGVFVVMGVSGLAAGYVYDELQGGIVACIGLFIVAVMYSVSVRNAGKSTTLPDNDVEFVPSGNTKGQLLNEIRSIKEQMLSEAVSCDFDDIPERSVLEARYDELKEYALGIRSVSELRLQGERLEKERIASSEQYVLLGSKRDDMRDFYQEIQAEWKEWLVSCDLDSDIAPEDMSDKFALVREGKDKLAFITDVQSQLLRCESLVEEFEVDAGKLLVLCECEVSGRSIDQDVLKLRDDVNAEFAKTGKVEQIKQDLHELFARSELLTADLKEKETERDIVLSKWKDWLARYDLSSEMTTESILDIFTSIKNCYEVQDKIKGMADKIGFYADSINVYEGKVHSVLDVCERKLSGLGFDTELELLRDDVERALSEKNRLDVLNSESDGLLFSLKDTEDKHLGYLNDMTVLLKEGSSESEDEFVSNAKIWDELVRAKNGYGIAESHVRKLSGNDDDHLKIVDELTGSRLDLLKAQEAEVTEMVAEIDDGLESLSNEKGSIRNQIRQLEGYNEGSALRLELESLKEGLNERSREWATYSVAQHILSKAMEKYERERQPDVITEAQTFFSNITGGKYERLYSPLGSSDIFVEDGAGKRKDIIELSRGTAEQLYLALRFGFIKELGKHSESLPIVFDDILVNFDQLRSRNAISSINELSLSNQVLYFTCHPGTVDMFRDVVPDVRVVELSEL